VNGSIRAIGWKAHAALARSAGRFAAWPGFDRSAYRMADGDLIWIATGNPVMHPRAVVFNSPTDAVELSWLEAVAPWHPTMVRFDGDKATALREGCTALAADVLQVGLPQGFAALLTGRAPAFPLDHAVDHVAALARAIDRTDAQAVCASALPLLGLGPGFTPSGDDLVGAVLFARRLLGMDREWTSAARHLIAAAQTRTHSIGATLFGDLAEAQSFAPLHRLAAALAARESPVTAARELVAIGHSSGWDMLAGFIVGVAGSAVLQKVKGEA